MKRTPLARRSSPMPQRKRMKPVSDKRRKHRASTEGKAGLAWMGRVKGLACVICGAPPPSDVHHCIHDRFGARKASDHETIPLCKRHHQDGPEAIHNGKQRWREKHGPDYGYIPVVRALLDEHDEIDF